MFEPCKKGNTFKNFKTRHFQTVFETKRKVNTIDYSNKERETKKTFKKIMPTGNHRHSKTSDQVKQLIELSHLICKEGEINFADSMR